MSVTRRKAIAQLLMITAVICVVVAEAMSPTPNIIKGQLRG